MRPPTQLAKLLICLQMLLMAVFMTVEVAHSHPVSASGHDASIHCELCATAHLATADEAALPIASVFRPVGTVIVGVRTRGSRTVVRTAFIRPPPVADPSLL